METDNKFQPERPAFLAKAPVLWKWLSGLLAFVVIIIFWVLAARGFSRDLLPGPNVIVQRIYENWIADPMISMVSGRSAGIGYHTVQTILRFSRYLSCGIIIGCLFMVAVCLERRSEQILRLLTWIANPIPPLLLLPVVHAAGCRTAVLEWIGGIFYPALAFISIGIGTLDGKNKPLELLARQAGAARLWIAIHVRWPMVESAVLPALKTHGTFTLGLTIVIEWMLAPNGLGQVMKYSLSFNSGALLLSTVVLVVIIAAIYEVLIQIIINLRLHWKIRSHAF
jgi:ABC-type nitrate/sulfonate/bicarbonate transport system permease component